MNAHGPKTMPAGARRSIPMIRTTLLAFSAMAILLVSCSRTESVEREAFGLLEKYAVDKKTGVKHGVFEKFELDMTLIEHAVYVDGKLQGERTIFYANGSPEIIEYYKSDILTGNYKAFYDNSQMEIEGKYTDGVMSGIWKRYYENGQLMEEVTFAENLENGPFIEYHENGKLKAEGQYSGGNKEQGVLKLYDENGELYRRMDCNDGICITTWLRPGYEEPSNE
jgi:antitoxin component YwqK of YwqJK toxin-antitoxin module